MPHRVLKTCITFYPETSQQNQSIPILENEELVKKNVSGESEHFGSVHFLLIKGIYLKVKMFCECEERK